MDRRYAPKSLKSALAWLTEEAGEVLAAVGKSGRFGLDSYNPELDPADRELNGDWIAREVEDLIAAATLARAMLARAGYKSKHRVEGVES